MQTRSLTICVMEYVCKVVILYDKCTLIIICHAQIMRKTSIIMLLVGIFLSDCSTLLMSVTSIFPRSLAAIVHLSVSSLAMLEALVSGSLLALPALLYVIILMGPMPVFAASSTAVAVGSVKLGLRDLANLFFGLRSDRVTWLLADWPRVR